MDTGKKPYVFNKRTHKAIATAEIVLGPKAVRQLITGLITNFSKDECIIDEELTNILAIILSFVDPKKQIVIKTDAGIVGGLTIETKPKEITIGDDFQGYTLIDLKTAIAEAIRGDFTGFVLQMLQITWKRELTIEDAENITFHLNEITKILK